MRPRTRSSHDAHLSQHPSIPLSLTSDCAHCAGLCCVSFPFDASDAFAYDKAGDESCRHLNDAFRCNIHDARIENGFSGCLVFECHGAGQRVTQETFKGQTWKNDPALMAPMGRAIRKMRQLHEFLNLLSTALLLDLPEKIEADIQTLIQEICPDTPFTPETLEHLDVVNLELRIQKTLQALRAHIPEP